MAARKRRRAKTVEVAPAAVPAVQVVKLGFTHSAWAAWNRLPAKVRDGLRPKLREVALHPELAKPLVEELAGCRRVSYGRIRCVVRIAKGMAVIVVIAIDKRKDGDKSDPYEIAKAEIRKGGEAVELQLTQLVAEAVKEMRGKPKR
jgi:mRNA-degrading endonuclease RelE of RelBE toxin-antitoxin system